VHGVDDIVCTVLTLPRLNLGIEWVLSGGDLGILGRSTVELDLARRSGRCSGFSVRVRLHDL
jgi:hypothetical protein